MILRLTIPLAFLGCVTAAPKADSPATAAATPESIVAAPDRSEADRALDPGRKPASLLQFLDLKPGMHVAELVAGGGYSTELMARAVAPTGVVYAENPKGTLQRFAEKPFSARLATPAMRNAVRVDRELDDPFPPQVHDLDLVLSFVVYHDGVWQGVDRPKMNAAVFRALRTGGVYAICDSSAENGHGV
jgi:predicted methyltransferase